MLFYMVGDNPLADIKGANNAGAVPHCCELRAKTSAMPCAAGKDWRSILVRTGIFSAEGNDPLHPADYVCDDVTAAVALVLNTHGNAATKQI